MEIEYYYRREVVESNEEYRANHDETLRLLESLRKNERIGGFVSREIEMVFPTEESCRAVFAELHLFTQRHKVALAHIFGSRKFGFSWMPIQFILVRENAELIEVFPCAVSGDEIAPTEYLERLLSGHPWTRRSRGGMQGKQHEIAVRQIIERPEAIESGLVFEGENVQVSADFAESGFIDLYFTDRKGFPLLLEVKVDWHNSELLKAIGQILYYRDLFAQQNRIERSRVRMGIVCFSIPNAFRATCDRLGIQCFEVAIDTS